MNRTGFEYEDIEANVAEPLGDDLAYADNIDPSQILKDPRFLNDLKEYYGSKGEYYASNDEYIDAFYSDSTWRDLNTVSAGKGALEAMSSNAQTRGRAKRIEQVWRSLPAFWQDGGRDTLGAITDIGSAVLLDPINLLGGVSGLVKGGQAARAAYLGGKTAGRSKLTGVGQGALAGGIDAAKYSAVAELGIEGATQARDKSLGLRDEFSVGRLAGMTALGAAGGALGGGAFGALGGYFGARGAVRVVDDLVSRGFTTQQIEQVITEGGEDAIKALAKSTEGPDTFFAEPEGIATGADSVAGEVPVDPMDAKIEKVSSILEGERKAYRDAVATGADDETIQEIKNSRDVFAALQSFGERLKREQAEIKRLEGTNELPNLNKAAKMRTRFEDDLDVFERISDADNPMESADARAILAQYKEKNVDDVLPEGEAPAAADTTTAKATDETTPVDETVPTEPVDKAPPKIDIFGDDGPFLNDKQKEEVRGVLNDGYTQADFEADYAKGIYSVPGIVDGQNKFKQSAINQIVAKAKDAGAKTEAPAPEAKVAPPEADGSVEKIDTPKILIDADSRGNALMAGLNPADITPAPKSKNGRVTKRRVDAAINANKSDEPHAVAVKAMEEAELVISKLPPSSSMTAKTFLEAAEVMSKRKDIGITSDPQDIMAIVRKTVNKIEENPSDSSGKPLTMTEEKAIKRRMKELMADNPEYSEQTARVLALGEINKRRGMPTQKESGVRSSSDSIEARSIFENAGRDLEGKIQGILKKGTSVGDGYTVTGQYRVKTNEIPKEEAILKADLQARSGKGPGIVTYVSGGEQAIGPNGAKVRVKKGTTLFADATTKRSYTDYTFLMRMLGQDIKKKDIKSVVKEAPEPEEGLTEESTRKALDAFNEDGDVEKFVKTITALGNGEKPKLAPVTEINTTSGSKKLIVRSKLDSEDVRMISEKQIRENKGIEAIIGQKGGAKSDPANWEVRYAPMEAKAPTSAARRKLFDSLPPEAEDVNPDAARLETGGATGRGDPMEIDDFDKLELELDDMDMATLKEISAYTPTAFFRNAEINGRKVFGRDVRAMVNNMESRRWPLKEQEIDRHIEHMAFVKGLEAKLSPNGYSMPTATRREAKLQIDKIFAGHPADEIAEAKRFIDSLGGDPDKAPLLIGKERLGGSQGLYSSIQNDIQIQTKQGPKDIIVQPRLNVLYHEVAHWAYHNILSPKDRSEFWNIAKSQYKGGRFDRTVNDDFRALPQGEANATREGQLFKINVATKPAEFFAEQFEMWATRNRQSPDLNTEKFWERIGGYVKAIFDRYYRGAKIDPNLEPLFAKIIPDIGEEKTFTLGVGARPDTPLGKHIHKRFIQVTLAREDIESAIASDSPSAIVNAHRELQKLLLEMVPNSKLVARDGVEQAIFSPLRKGVGRRGMVKLIRDRINNYDEIIDGKQYGTDDGFDARNYGDFSTESDMEKVADQLKDFYHNGYAGTFVPAEGVPGRIKNLQASSTENLLGMLDKQLNNAYQRVEETVDLVPDSKPSSLDRGAAPKRANGEVKGTTTIRNAKKKKDRQDNLTTEEAVNNSKKKRNDRARDGKEAIDAGRTNSVKGKSIADLRALYVKHKGSDYGDQIGLEIVNKIKSSTIKGKPVKVSRETFKMSGQDLEVSFLDALHTGDKDRLSELLFEIQRRQNNKRAKSGTGKILSPRFKKTKDALQIEINHSRGVMASDGIPPSARASVREMLSFITHRSPEIETTSRTIAYRMFNILNKASVGTMEDVNKVTMDDMARLAGGDYSVSGGGAFGNYQHPDFKNFRNLVRRLGTSLTKETGNPDEVFTELNKMVIRSGALESDEMGVIQTAYKNTSPKVRAEIENKYGSKYNDFYSSTKEDMLAYEWFGDSITKYMKEDITRDDILADALGDDMYAVQNISLMDDAINRTAEYASYIINGQIGRQDVKDAFRRVTFYGDMFEDTAVSRPMAGTLQGKYLTHPSYAADYAYDTFMSMPKDKQARVLNFTNKGFGEDQSTQMPIFFYHGTPRKNVFKKETNPNIHMRPSEVGVYGPGIYVTENPYVASQMYARTPTFQAMVDAIDGVDLPDNIKEDLHFDAYELVIIRRDIGKLRRQFAEFDPESDVYLAKELTAERTLIKEQLDELIQAERAIVDNFKNKGLELEGDVLPTVINLKSPADFRANTVYSDEEHPFIEALAAKFLEEGLPSQVFSSLSGLGRNNSQLGPRTGEDIYKSIIDSMINFGGRSRSGAQSELNGMLQEMGYDGLLTTHRNSLNDGPELMETNRTYGATSREHTTAVLFKPNQVKHIDADDFDQIQEGLFKSEPKITPIPKGATGGIVEALSSESISKVDDIPVGEFGELLETAGGDPSYVGALMSLMRKRTITPKEEQAIRRQGASRFLDTQSNRMKKMEANWLAGWYKDHFPKLNSRFAGIYFPIQESLRKLPDSDGSLKRWFKKSVNVGGKIGRYAGTDRLAEQPQSYKKIVKALRYGDGTRQEKLLTEPERLVYKQVRAAFDAERKAMVEAGIDVGYRRNYFPQVWSADKITKNVNEFRVALKNYHQAERTLNGLPPSPEVESDAFAKGIIATLTEEGSDGVYHAIRGTTRNPTFENVDYSRIINLDDPRLRDNLKELEPFLEDDLDAMLVKYFEGSSRRMTHIDELGVNSHAVYDYLKVADEGLSGIADLLTTDKVFRMDRTSMNADGKQEIYTLQELVAMPFSGGGRHNVRPFVEKLDEANRVGGAPAVRQLLYSVAPVDGTTGKINPTYRRRAEAIVHALEDFGGKQGALQPDDHKFIEASMQVAMKKPMDGQGNQSVMNFSRKMRFFNNVTLLSYTTLTSLGDVVLPIIRSGSMKSYIKALAQMNSLTGDPAIRRGIINTGVAMENIVHERMIHLYGAPDGKASHAFFNATLLTDWTDMQRKIAGATAFNWFQSMQEKAYNNFKPSKGYGEQTRSYKEAHRALKQYGLEKFLPNQRKERVALGNTKMLEDPDVKLAILKFADDSIFQPNPNDVPMWAQTPFGALVFQLKSFPLMMARMGGHVMREMDKGNFKPAMGFFLLGPAFGAGTLSVKDVLQSRGGEENKSPEVRKRNLAKILGHDEKTHGDYNDFLGWYFEGMAIMGGFGLLGDIIHSFATQIDNGAYGANRMVSTLLGPTVGLVPSAMTTAAGIFDDKGNSNAKERAAAREFATRIPIVGGNRAAREGIVDAIAGENTKGRGRFYY